MTAFHWEQVSEFGQSWRLLRRTYALKQAEDGQWFVETSRMDGESGTIDEESRVSIEKFRAEHPETSEVRMKMEEALAELPSRKEADV